MIKFANTVEVTPKARLPEGAKILSPQRVDLMTNKHGIVATPQYQNHQTIDTGFSKNPRFRSGHDNFHPKSAGFHEVQSRPETSHQGAKVGQIKGINSINRNAIPGARPATSGEAFAVRQPYTQRNGHSPPRKGDFKIKRVHSLYPIQKADGFNSAPPQGDIPLETTKEDREAVEGLEKWDNEFKIVTISKALEGEQKKDANQIHQFQSEKYEHYKTPTLNREIIHVIDEDDGYAAVVEKDGKFVTNHVANMNKQKPRMPQKSLEMIMTEYNKKILNEILYQRVSKQINGNGRDTPNQNKRDLDYTTKAVSTGTIGNFKNLQQTMMTNPRIIEYEALYQKLSDQKHLPEKVFDLEDDKKLLQDAENDYATIEANLKVQFEETITDIHSKKEMLNELRLNVHNNNEEIKYLEEEIEELQRKYQALESQYNQQREQNKNFNRANTRSKRSGIKEVTKQAANIEEYSKVQRQMEEKKEQIEALKEGIEGFESENQKSQQKLNGLEREIKDLKFKKNQLRLRLKHLYLKILKNEEHIFKNESSFITIIKNMWNIHEDVTEDMFPSFVDKETMTYLTENAKLEYELEQLERFSKNDGFKEVVNNDPQLREEIYTKFNKVQQSLKIPLSAQLANVKKRLQDLKKGIVKMKKPVFIKDGAASRSRVIRWEELNLEADELPVHHIDEHMQEKINEAILSIKQKLAELKEREINRIFGLYINKEVEEKNLRNLNKILLSLFGRVGAEKTYLRFIRLKQSHDFKIAQNKTFVFSSTKQTSNIISDKNKNSYTLMLAFASNFRPEKPRPYTQGGKTHDVIPKEEQEKEFAQELAHYDETAQYEVNFNYNLNYNYANELQDKDPKAHFYVQKPSAPNDLYSTKGSFRDKNKMNRTGSSFNKVTFQEPAIVASEQYLRPNSQMSNLESTRKLLKSAK